MGQYRWTQRDLLKALRYVGYELNPSRLSGYLRHGGDIQNGVTDQGIIIILGVLGIKIETKVEFYDVTLNKATEHYKHFFPGKILNKEDNEEIKKVPRRLVEYLKMLQIIK